ARPRRRRPPGRGARAGGPRHLLGADGVGEPPPRGVHEARLEQGRARARLLLLPVALRAAEAGGRDAQRRRATDACARPRVRPPPAAPAPRRAVARARARARRRALPDRARAERAGGPDRPRGGAERAPRAAGRPRRLRARGGPRRPLRHERRAQGRRLGPPQLPRLLMSAETFRVPPVSLLLVAGAA